MSTEREVIRRARADLSALYDAETRAQIPDAPLNRGSDGGASRRVAPPCTRLVRQVMPPCRHPSRILKPAIVAVLGCMCILGGAQAIALRMADERQAAIRRAPPQTSYCGEVVPTKSGYWQRCYWDGQPR